MKILAEPRCMCCTNFRLERYFLKLLEQKKSHREMSGNTEGEGAQQPFPASKVLYNRSLVRRCNVM